jgi:hypothetical protein
MNPAPTSRSDNEQTYRPDALSCQEEAEVSSILSRPIGQLTIVDLIWLVEAIHRSQDAKTNPKDRP